MAGTIIARATRRPAAGRMRSASEIVFVSVGDSQVEVGLEAVDRGIMESLSISVETEHLYAP